MSEFSMEFGKCLVLVADDDPELREAIRDALDWEGFRVMEACDGEEALLLAREHRPQVLLIDHRMPGLTGAEVCRALREQHLDIHIIFCTAAREGFRLTQGLEVECFLSKPFDLDSVLDSVKSVCI